MFPLVPDLMAPVEQIGIMLFNPNFPYSITLRTRKGNDHLGEKKNDDTDQKGKNNQWPCNAE